MGDRRFVITEFSAPQVGVEWKMNFMTITEPELERRLAAISLISAYGAIGDDKFFPLAKDILLHGTEKEQPEPPMDENEPVAFMAGLTPLGVTGWNGRPDFVGQGSTLCAAICAALVTAVEGKE